MPTKAILHVVINCIYVVFVLLNIPVNTKIKQ